MQERAAAIGYDWPDIEGVLDKVAEELGELARAGDGDGAAARSSATCCSWSSTSGAGWGSSRRRALRAANDKFRGRFRRVERMVARARRRHARPRLRDPRPPVGCCQGGGASRSREPPGARREWRPGMSIGNRPPAVRSDGRGPVDLRPVTLTLGVLKWAEGSCRIRVGDTEVLCAATIGDRVPPHLRGKGPGWVTAEYSMLPRATAERSERESGQGPPRRPDARDPAPHRPVAARRRRPGQARRADGHRRLRRPPGRWRHALRLDHRRLRRPGRGADRRRAWSGRSSARSRRSPSAWSAASRCSTSTTPRIRTPRSTSTSWAPMPARTSSSRARRRAGRSTGPRVDELLDLANTGLARLFEAQATALATVRR